MKRQEYKSSIPNEPENNKGKYYSYPNYKKIDIDWLKEIPAHWDTVKLKYLGTFRSGKRPPSKDDNGPFPIIGANGKVGYCNDANLDSKRIVIGRVGSSGEINIAPKNSWVTDNAIILNHELYNGNFDYLFYALKSLDLGSLITKNAQPLITANIIKEQFIPLVPKKEQRAIAQFLDRETSKIDRLIEKKEKLIDLLEEKRTALIEKVITKGINKIVETKKINGEFLKEIPSDWGFTKLKFLVEKGKEGIKTGPFGSQLKASEMNDNYKKVYNQQNVIESDFATGDNYVSEKKYEELSSFAVKPGDLLVTTRGTIGNCAEVPEIAEDGILHPCLMRVRPKEEMIIPQYLIFLIEDCGFVDATLKLQSNTTVLDVIYSSTLANLKVPLPPKKKQKEIVSFLKEELNSINNVKKKTKNAVENLKEYRTALISAAVTGKIDVRGEVE